MPYKVFEALDLPSFQIGLPECGLFMQIFVKDVWKEYTGWPLNNMEQQYKFMVKHVGLWSVAFHGTSPRWIHSVYLAAIAAFYAKYVTVSSAFNFFCGLVPS